ncbi:MAG: hypothetical protein R2726_12905 [Acidimicrobiales bacterium]
MAESAPLTVPFPYADVFQAAVEVLQSQATVTSKDPARGVIEASTPPKPWFRTYGESIVVRLWQIRPQATGVEIASRARLNYGLDSARDHHNVDDFMTELRAHLEQRWRQDREPGAPLPPPPIAAPPPAGPVPPDQRRRSP